MSVQIHVVRVVLVNDAVYWHGGAFVVVEGEVPTLAAAVAPIQAQVSAVGDVEGAVRVALLESASLRRNESKRCGRVRSYMYSW